MQKNENSRKEADICGGLLFLFATAATARDTENVQKLAFITMTKKRCQMNAALVITKSGFYKSDFNFQR